MKVVDSIHASLIRKLCDAFREGYDVLTIYPNEKDDDELVGLKGDDLLKMSFKENFFHRTIYIWNLSGYNPALADLFTKVFDHSQPGSVVSSSEWVTTESYRPDNPKHVEIINAIKTTLRLPDLRSASEISKLAEEAGYEVVEKKDNLVNSSRGKPWFERLKEKRSRCRRRYKAIKVLVKLGLVPKSTMDDYRILLLKAVDYLIKGGETGIFSPAYITRCQKPGKPPQA
ncbi:hypothetical protein OSB04_014408 [Centaurea solstitialis]|uniref:Sterol methyltransferase C-terminal domain-containing protein n=1 Tax=Centaurea solstitialis TaxID=347529 RepID=A0AA38SX89_9ASTR|nr:hypothetical protein OSB04_014408 [Centaurea solstitialis]